MYLGYIREANSINNRRHCVQSFFRLLNSWHPLAHVRVHIFYNYHDKTLDLVINSLYLHITCVSLSSVKYGHVRILVCLNFSLYFGVIALHNTGYAQRMLLSTAYYRIHYKSGDKYNDNNKKKELGARK